MTFNKPAFKMDSKISNPYKNSTKTLSSAHKL